MLHHKTIECTMFTLYRGILYWGTDARERYGRIQCSTPSAVSIRDVPCPTLTLATACGCSFRIILPPTIPYLLQCLSSRTV